MMPGWPLKIILMLVERCFGRKPLAEELDTDSGGVSPAPASEKDADHHARQPLSPMQINELAAELDTCTAAMQHECKRVETDFLHIGERLQAIYAQAIGLAQNAQGTVEGIGFDNENNLLAKVIQSARQALGDLEQEQGKIQQSLERVHTVGERLDSLHHMIGGLKKIAKTLKMVAININIESSRSAESLNSFLVLAQEIRSLSDAVALVARTLSGDTQNIVANLGAMDQAVEGKLDQFQQLTRSAQATLERTAPDVLALIDRSVHALQHVGDDAKALSQSAGEIVVNLQIHDNISQRVAHIAQALSDARQQLLTSGGSAEAMGMTETSLELQQAQLKSILADIERAHQHSAQAFGAIAQSVEDIARGLAAIASDGGHGPRPGPQGSSSIESLKAALQKIQGLIGQSRLSVVELKEITQEAMLAVARIAEQMKQVQDVNFDIHLKALNAIFKSIRLGSQGKAIVALVQEMKDLANQSNTLVAQVDTINKDIMQDAAALQERIHADSGSGDRPAAAGGFDLAAGIGEFADASAAFLQNAGNLAQLSHGLTEQIDTTANALAFLQPFADRLRGQLLQMDALRGRLAPWATAGHGSEKLDRQRLIDRYTMQHERDIHTIVLDRQAPQTATPAECAAPLATTGGQVDPASGESELGDNVELF
jgi:chromosome segregation ATPase